jgi:CRISPR-associated protein Cmr4
MTTQSFESFYCAGMALDPIHVGDGGARLGRVDNTVVREPVTQLPKIPGSSYAGVSRAYVAMAEETERDSTNRERPFYPDCAGQGQPNRSAGHCCRADCPVCTVFGFAGSEGAGFAGLAAFSDMHLLLHPVATRHGPRWVTSPLALYDLCPKLELPDAETIYSAAAQDNKPLNLGWLMLPSHPLSEEKGLTDLQSSLRELGISEYIRHRLVVVADKLFQHVVNSTLEVRTSVAINPATGAAEEGALFTYEALPRGTVLSWTVTCRDPNHFKVSQDGVSAVASPHQVFKVVRKAEPYLENLGLGGMNTRGMGRLRVTVFQDEDNGKTRGTE